MEGFSMEGMSAQAQQIWSMLDDLAENNPAAYRKFIDKQIKEGKEHMAMPEPHMCVQVLLLTKPQKPLFINFCSWNRVPEPKSPEEAVPVSGTQITHEVDGKEKFSLTSVAFNPNVLKEYGRGAKNPADADTLIQLALDYIEHEQKVKVSRSYTVLPVDVPHKGDLALVQMSFTKLLNKNSSDDHDQDVNWFDQNRSGATGSPKSPDSVLSQLSNITVTNSPDNGNQSSLDNINIFNTQKSSKSKKGLIEELDSSKLLTPKYTLETVELDSGRALVLTVNLPNVKGVSECELDISEDDVDLTVPAQYELKLRLPSNISEDESRAKFSKKNSTLTVTMPVKS